jgi:hypothetical protein
MSLRRMSKGLEWLKELPKGKNLGFESFKEKLFKVPY